MKGRWPFTAEKIATRLSLIAPKIHRRALPLDPFRLMRLPAASVSAPICADPSGWEVIEPHAQWGHADLNFVLKNRFTVPEDWHPDRLALHLPLGVLGDIFNHPEALVHIDAEPIASADRYHHTIPLSADLADGRDHVLSLHGWTGLAGWPPDPASKARLTMGAPALVERDPRLLAFHGLASAMLDTTHQLEIDGPEQRALLNALETAFRALDTRDPMGEAFYASVPEAMVALILGLKEAGPALDVTLHGIGHAHMDIAYLWPVSQIRLKNARTYSNVLRLMEAHPDFTFSHSQPQLYAMMAEDYPAIFERIKARVAEGRWEVMGGMWVEPDLNIPGPEALVRQLMLGRGYFRETFGDVETPVLWLPDTFGFPGQTPQLMRHAGLKWFATNKLNWNQRNKVPATHWWEGIDGSGVLAHILTTPRDVQYLPFPTNYKSDLSAFEVMGTWTNSGARESLRELPICYGYGDGGGGPTEDLLRKADAYGAMPGMPKLAFSTVRAAFERMEETARDLPLWRGEHYMEGHRGVYTSQGWIKRAIRKAEWALHEAEAMAAMAGLRLDLTEAWQRLCLNQFHDIATGTSITQVFDDARRDFTWLRNTVEREAQRAADALCLQEPAVANTSPVSTSRLVDLPAEAGIGQETEAGRIALMPTLRAYSVTPLSAATEPDTPARCTRDGKGLILENAHLKLWVASSGQFTRVLDKRVDRDVLLDGARGNRLAAFEDRPICWDAWDIDPFFEDRVEIIDGPCRLEILEDGPLRAAIRITTPWRASEIVQTIRLAAHSARIDMVTEVDWRETHTLLKAVFPTSLSAKKALFDIQWGAIERGTAHDSAFDAARFEVPAQKWAMVQEGDYAVALLNDCKYGYDVKDGTIRITLIKSSTSPDPVADQGRHRFTYSLLPLPGADRALLDAEAYDLNAPLRYLPAGTGGASGPLFRYEARNVIVETVKPAEEGDAIILRLFEAHGLGGAVRLVLPEGIAQVQECAFDEVPRKRFDIVAGAVGVALRPFQIVTLRLERSAPSRRAV